jgi:hypothetical protein
MASLSLTASFSGSRPSLLHAAARIPKDRHSNKTTLNSRRLTDFLLSIIDGSPLLLPRSCVVGFPSEGEQRPSLRYPMQVGNESGKSLFKLLASYQGFWFSFHRAEQSLQQRGALCVFEIAKPKISSSSIQFIFSINTVFNYLNPCQWIREY